MAKTYGFLPYVQWPKTLLLRYQNQHSEIIKFFHHKRGLFGLGGRGGVCVGDGFQRSYKSVEGYRSNPVLAVKRSFLALGFLGWKTCKRRGLSF